MEIDLISGPADADVTAFAVLDPVGTIPDLDPRLAGLARAGEINGAAGSTCVLHQDGGRRFVAAGPRSSPSSTSIRSCSRPATARRRRRPCADSSRFSSGCASAVAHR